MSNQKHIVAATIVFVALILIIFYSLIAVRMHLVSQPPSVDEITDSTLSESSARVIAESMCIKGGESLQPGSYNEVTKTWWFDANLNATQPGCNPACVVYESTGLAEINWRCTGLIPPDTDSEPPTVEPPDDTEGVACTADAKLCPDGSGVGRVPPSCEFAPCPDVTLFGTVWGFVHMGPTCPVVRVDDPACLDKPYVGVVQAIRIDGSDLSVETSTDPDGGFSLKLPNGDYTLHVLTEGIFPICETQTVSISDTQPIRADISCDTGIR